MHGRRSSHLLTEEIIPPSDDVLQGVASAGDKILAMYLKDASSRLRVFSEAGEFVQEIELPALGTLYGMDGEPDRNEFFSALFPLRCRRQFS